MKPWERKWEFFKRELPHKRAPFCKRNWGHPLHSLCSYQGKLKPSIAHFLIDAFTDSGDRVLDPFSGVGTIPFEGAIQGRKVYAFDLSRMAYAVTKAKLDFKTACRGVEQSVCELENYLRENEPTVEELEQTSTFGYNGKIVEYYHPDTLREVILARRYFRQVSDLSPSDSLVLSSLLHILHGNRPYALSRRSHPITPYSPTGEFSRRAVIPKLKEKIERSVNAGIPIHYTPGMAYNIDATGEWPAAIDSLSAVITSPPFFDSTRFYMYNWLRMWFSGWEPEDFQLRPKDFVDERQKVDFSVYTPILAQAHDRLRKGGALVMHLGVSHKCNMADSILNVASGEFSNYSLFTEDVADTESHGIRDKGTVTGHSYLVLYD